MVISSFGFHLKVEASIEPIVVWDFHMLVLEYQGTTQPLTRSWREVLAEKAESPIFLFQKLYMMMH
jgi:hypothetical protein